MKFALILPLPAIVGCNAPAPDAEEQSRLQEEVAYTSLKQENRKNDNFTHLLKFKSRHDLPTLTVAHKQGVKQPFTYLGNENCLYSFESRVELEPPYGYWYPEMDPRRPDSTLLSQLGERRLVVLVDTNAVISLKYQPAYSLTYSQAPQDLSCTYFVNCLFWRLAAIIYKIIS